MIKKSENNTIEGVKKFDFTKIIGIENIKFGKNVIIDDFVFIYATDKIVIGSNVHIACFASITGGAKIEIGDFCAISQGCRILAGTDDFKYWGFGNSTIDEKYRNTKRAPIKISKFAIIGANSVVLPGVTIGEGVAVGASSVVTRDLEPWGIYIGNRKIGERDKNGILINYKNYLEHNEN
jgi:acetyltransferase-like isoleucine patch superfamily enzyme